MSEQRNAGVDFRLFLVYYGPNSHKDQGGCDAHRYRAGEGKTV